MTGGLLVVGCGISAVGTMQGSAVDPPDASPSEAGPPLIDTGIDVPVADAPETCATWTARHFTPCAIPGPGPAITVPPGATITYDTNLPGFVEDPPADPPALVLGQGGTEAVLISVASLTIPAGTTFRAIGARPLVIASWSTIDIQGVLDVGSSTAQSRSGAGANPTACGVGAAQAGDDETTNGGGSGGGGGGAFRGNGGKGGPGDSGGENPGGNGGQMLASAPTIVRGGCPGARSGKAGPDPAVTASTGDDTTTAGGAGGGAIQLSARLSITVGAMGRVRASGAGGFGAPTGSACGGGGGGSGGYVGFDAPAYSFVANARVASNGGGGGSSALFVESGGNGGDGTDDATQAPGGPYGDSCAHPGPPGAAGTTLDGPNANQGNVSCGGGGGGGAVGFILVFGAFTAPADVVFSPTPTIVP